MKSRPIGVAILAILARITGGLLVFSTPFLSCI
jgi:hypothetical protein